MELGFSSVGNATLIFYDSLPILATDPWITGYAYFGSWNLSHKIPDQQLTDINDCKYLWISHGHPDHLSLESLSLLKDSRILLPDHFNKRLFHDLSSNGFQVSILESNKWHILSDNIKILSLADHNQDTKLLVNIGEFLLVNMNDAGLREHGRIISNITRQFDESNVFLTGLSGHGDADMINFFDESGNQVLPPQLVRSKNSPKILGYKNSKRTESMRSRYFLPSSSFHVYHRTDSN